ncbi:MAG: hypothetical protein QOG62_565 [Thermoleophilaceae bacterium]|nr:hypothetical protein [Thermoleophilaceae bacterium]
MDKKLQLTPAFAVVVAVVVAGCGGGGSTEASSAITKADFISQADAICTESNAAMEGDIKATFGGGAHPGKAEEKAFVTGVIVPSIEGDLQKVGALPKPAGDEAAISAFLDDANAGVAEAKNDPAGFPASAPSLAKSSDEAAAYGLKVCGQDAGQDG